MNAPASLDLAGYRVAVVDDNRNFRELLRTMLRAFGVRRVDSLAEPDDVVPFLCQNYVDLVFLDLVMPGMDGIQLAREIRHKAGIAKRAMPIVLVTGQASRATVVKAVAAGIDDIIVKPVSPQTILRRSRRLLLKPPNYVAGLDGYFGPDVAERRQSVERRLSADRWRLLKAQPYRVINLPGGPGLPKPAMVRALPPGATPVAPTTTAAPTPAGDGAVVPGLSARSVVKPDADPATPTPAPVAPVKPSAVKPSGPRVAKPAAAAAKPAAKPSRPPARRDLP